MARGLLVLVLLAAVSAAAPTSARKIAADLSKHEIEITAGFDGTELLLFGHDSTSADVIVIVRGPDAPVAVRRKERVAGIWVNNQEVAFTSAPGFYYVSVTDGLAKAGTLDAILSETGLGARYLNLATAGTPADAELVEEFRQALVELKSRQQLYAAEPGRIEMRADGLFRTEVPFPAATPIGTYTVSVYHVVDGWPVAAASTPLKVRKAGFGAFVYETAHEQPLLYGVIAIVVAAGAGWFAGWASKRG